MRRDRSSEEDKAGQPAQAGKKDKGSGEMTIAGPLLYVIGTAAAVIGYRASGWMKTALWIVAAVCFFCAITGATIFVPQPGVPQIHTSPSPK